MTCLYGGAPRVRTIGAVAQILFEPSTEERAHELKDAVCGKT